MSRAEIAFNPNRRTVYVLLSQGVKDAVKDHNVKEVMHMHPQVLECDHNLMFTEKITKSICKAVEYLKNAPTRPLPAMCARKS